jgi:hypothetical protein
MTKKEYKLLANEFKQIKKYFILKKLNEQYDHGKYDTWYVLRSSIATALEENDPKFDFNKFIEATEV